MSDINPTRCREVSVFLDVRELAAMLRVAPITIYRLVKRRALPVHRAVRRILFRRTDVEVFLDAHRFSPGTPVLCL